MGEIKDKDLMSKVSGKKVFKTDTKYVNSKFICVDTSYQRILYPSEVEAIIKELDPNVERKPRVSLRCGKYYVFNGQHTVAMLKELNGGEDLMIECDVYYGMTKADEADQFRKQDGKVKKLKTEELLNGALVGNDPDVIAFKDLVESAGYACDFKNPWSGDYRLVCFKTAYGIFRQKNGPERLKKILEIITAAWDGQSDGLRRQIIGGMNIVIRENEGLMDEKKMIEKLKKVSPLKIFRDGNALPNGGQKRFAKKIVEVYNSGLRKDKLKEVVL